MSLVNDPQAQAHSPVVPDSDITSCAVAVALLHNDALSSPDQLSIHELITSYEDEVRNLDPEIARVQKLLHELQSRQTVAITRIHSCRIAIAPHRKLPNEILAQIFIYAAPEKVSIIVPKGHTERSPLYNILLVCSRWNDIALGERRLWNNVEVNFDNISPNFCPRNFARSGGVVLDRIGLSPISLIIRLNFKAAPSSLPKMIQNFLMRSERRLNRLELSMGCIQPQILCEISSGFFARLEVVSITIDTALQTNATTTLFEDASELREFTFTTLSTTVCIFVPTMFPLPWSQLTTLRFGTMFALHPSDAHTMLCQCTSLVNCEISVKAPGNPSVKQCSPIIMPSLRRLRLVLHNKSNPWLLYFCFPGLITLELDYVPLHASDKFSWNGDSDSDLQPFIRNLSKLGSLTVNLDMTPHIVEKLLQNVPTLTSLALPETNSMLEGILGKIANGSLVPRLNHLVCKVDTLSWALDMIESRLKDARAATIRDVTILYARCCTAEDRERITTLRKGGLSIDTPSQL